MLKPSNHVNHFPKTSTILKRSARSLQAGHLTYEGKGATQGARRAPQSMGKPEVYTEVQQSGQGRAASSPWRIHRSDGRKGFGSRRLFSWCKRGEERGPGALGAQMLTCYGSLGSPGRMSQRPAASHSHSSLSRLRSGSDSTIRRASTSALWSGPVRRPAVARAWRFQSSTRSGCWVTATAMLSHAKPCYAYTAIKT